MSIHFVSYPYWIHDLNDLRINCFKYVNIYMMYETPGIHLIKL